MPYTLNEYHKHRETNVPRIEIYSSNSAAASLLSKHKESGCDVLPVSDCVPSDAVSLPMPNAVIAVMDSKIKAVNKRIAVTGIDAYLALLSIENVRLFFAALRTRIDAGKMNVVYLMSHAHNPKSYFTNPKYIESLDVVEINEGYDLFAPPKVEVVSSKWVNPVNNLGSFKDLLIKLEMYFIPTAEQCVLCLTDLRPGKAGLNDTVMFYTGIIKTAEQFYGITADLKPDTLEILISKAREKSMTPEAVIEDELGKENIDNRRFLFRLRELPDDALFSAYVWMLRKRMPSDAYAAKVLSSEITHANLLRKYIVDAAISLLGNDEAKRYAAERAEVIKSLGNEKDTPINDFITQTQEDDYALAFLNCGTKAELRELIRRVSKFDLVTGLPDVFKRLCPSLADYLSTEFDYGNTDLTIYFKEYRRFKIRNTITEEFVQKAYDYVLPDSFPAREAILLPLSADVKTSLLVVDGMGAEYLPLMLSMAKRHGMNIESYDIACSKLPSSTTPFNPIMWESDRMLDSIREIDNIAHNGEAKHENCPHYRNLAAVFHEFETEIFPRIAAAFEQFSRVVVTADHGSSRLAVLAHENKLIEDLPWDKQHNGEPLDWRYSYAPSDKPKPPEFIREYYPDSDKTYWIVRGYNRLPKPGGKKNELHGGASLEERLVPIIVFTQEKVAVKPKQLGKKTAEQIVEKIGFDID